MTALDASHALPSRPIPLERRALAITAGLSYAEFLAAYPDVAPILASRRTEVRLRPDDQLFLSAYPDWLHLVVIVEVDSPDTFILLPLLARLAEASPRLELRILTTDDDLALLAGLVDEVDLLDEEGEVDFPQLLIFDEEWDCEAQWGPRPQVAEGYLDRWIEDHPDYVRLMEMGDEESSPAQDAQLAQLTHHLYHEMRVWYGGDAAQAAVTEIRTLLADLLPDEVETVGDEGESLANLNA